MKNTIVLLWFAFFSLHYSTAKADECLEKVMGLLKEEKYKEADKYVQKEDCEIEIKAEKGTVEKDAKTFGNDIMMIYSSHIGCEKAVEKHFKLPKEGQSPLALEQKLIANCGPKAYSYKIISDLKRTTGIDLWEESRWVKLITEEKQKDKEKVEKEIAKEKKEEKDRADYENSAKYALDEACHKYQRLQLVQSAINDESESAKFSGVKDKKRLLSLGRQANAFTKLLNRYKQEYKSKTGKQWDASLCK